MANLGSIASLKSEINQNIVPNGNQEITGEKMNQALNDIVDTVHALGTSTTIEGNVTNNPDNEDLTSVSVGGQSVLKFKDRVSDTDQMGYVILRQDASFASQVTLANTIYEIRYAFDLDEEEVEIPANCVMKFNGGKIVNGTLVGEDTKIEASIVEIFDNITLSGGWGIEYGFVEWFGAKGDGENDDRAAIQSAINNLSEIHFLDKIYNIASYTTISDKNIGIVVPIYKNLRGINLNSGSSWIRASVEMDSVLYLTGAYISIKDLAISGGGSYPEHLFDGLAKNGIESSNEISHISLENVRVSYCSQNGFDIKAYIVRLRDCLAYYCEGKGFYIHYTNGRGTSLLMETCFAYRCFGNGYHIANMSYSSLVGCACDLCGYDGDVAISSFQAAYNIENCNATSLISCGLEGCYKAYHIHYTCMAISLIDCRAALVTTLGYDSKDAIQFDYVHGTSLRNCFVTFDVAKQVFISIRDTSDNNQYPKELVFDNCWTQNELQWNVPITKDNLTENVNCFFLPNELSKFESKKAFSKYNEDWVWTGYQINEVTEIAEISSIQNVSNFAYVKPIVYHIKDTGTTQYWNGGRIENLATSLYIIPNSAAQQRITVGSISLTNVPIFENCEKVIFENINFTTYITSSVTLYLLQFKNVEVEFKNCKFSNWDQSATAEGWFKSTHSRITLIDCSFDGGALPLLTDDDGTNEVIYIDNNKLQSSSSGVKYETASTTSNRPSLTSVYKGFAYFDTTLGKPIWWSGTAWVDATGTSV